MDAELAKINVVKAELRSYSHNFSLYLLLAILFIPVLFMPMIHEPDTNSYIFFDSQRPPILPLLLNIDKFITGDRFYLLRILQISVLVAAILYLDRWLREDFSIPKYAIITLVFLFFMPIIYHGHFGRMLISEAVSIPLYLITIVILCKLFLRCKVKAAIVFSICVSLLILTRNQFFYLYGFFPLFILWSWYQRMGMKKIAIFSGIFMSCVLFTTIFSFGYHKIVNNKFANTSADGALLLVQPLYLAKRTDVRYFQDSREKALFLAIYDHAARNGFLRTEEKWQHPGFSIGLDILSSYVHFVDVFNLIQFQSLNLLLNMGYSTYLADNLMTKMTRILLQCNLKENLLFYLWKFNFSLGGPLVTVLFIMLAVIALITVLKNRNNTIAIITLVLLTLVFANNFTVAISEMILYRYLIYMGMSLSILLTILFCQKKQNLN